MMKLRLITCVALDGTEVGRSLIAVVRPDWLPYRAVRLWFRTHSQTYYLRHLIYTAVNTV